VRGIPTCLPVTGRRESFFEICNLQFEIPALPAFGDQRRRLWNPPGLRSLDRAKGLILWTPFRL